MHVSRVSVIIPTRNAAKYIKDAVDSILAQTFADFELLVIDDSSTDGTLGILAEYTDPRLSVMPGPGRGLGAALNAGVRAARGEFIARMDADDISHPTRFQKQVDYLDANPQLGVCGTLFQQFMGGSATPDHMENVRYIDMMSGCYIGHPTAMFRRRLFVENDLFYNETMRYSEDYDLWSRAIRITGLGNVREILLDYRRHDESSSLADVVKMTELDVGVKLGMIDYLVGGLQAAHRGVVYQLLTNGPVTEAARVSCIKALMQAIQHKHLCSPLELVSYFHQIKPFERAEFVELAGDVIRDTPFFVVSFNHLTYLKSIVEFFKQIGAKNVHIIDNDSSYPPLREYLDTIPFTVHKMDGNYRHMVLFEREEFRDIIDNSYFVLTDPDILPAEECPPDFLIVFMDILLRYPRKNKVGFSLKIDDLPDHYELKHNVIAWESRFFSKPSGTIGGVLYDAPIDTTFALYRPRREWRTPDFYEAFRIGEPYTARHLPWYRNLLELTEEELYYRKTDTGSSNWNGTMTAAELHQKYGTTHQPAEAGATPERKRLSLFAAYSANNVIEDYVVHLIEKLSEHSTVYYFAANDMPESELSKLDHVVAGRWASAHDRYDFGSWQELVWRLGWEEIEKYGSLLLVNDSNYGPASDLGMMFDEMDARGFDFWGVTENYGESRHLQSYFLNFGPAVMRASSFRNFFEGIKAEQNKRDICINYEIGVSRLLGSEGFKFGSYIDREALGLEFGVDASAYQNTLLRGGSPFVKRKVFVEDGFAQEAVSETLQLLAIAEYPKELLPGGATSVAPINRPSVVIQRDQPSKKAAHVAQPPALPEIKTSLFEEAPVRVSAQQQVVDPTVAHDIRRLHAKSDHLIDRLDHISLQARKGAGETTDVALGVAKLERTIQRLSIMINAQQQDIAQLKSAAGKLHEHIERMERALLLALRDRV